MVGEPALLVYARATHLVPQRGRNHLVVDATTDILRAVLPAVAPPGVALVRRVGIQRTIGIDPSRLTEQHVHPGPLVRQESGILLIGFPVLQIGIAMRDVPIAAYDEIAAARRPLFQGRDKERKKTILRCLPVRTSGAGRKVKRHDREPAEARFDATALVIEFLLTEAALDLIGRAPAVKRDARVAFLDRVFVETVIARGTETGVRLELLHLRLGFLQADDVSILRGQPVEKALLRRRADAVEIEADYAHLCGR